MTTNQVFTVKIAFNDEFQFYLSAHVKQHNFGIWGDDIPDAVTEVARDISKMLYFVDRASRNDYW